MPPNLTGISSYDKQLSDAQIKANHYEALLRKGNKSGFVVRSARSYANLANRLRANGAKYTQSWINSGRPGALEALQARYKTPESVAQRLTPFDPQGGVESLSAKRTLDQNLINLTGQENMLNQQYGTSKRDYEAKIPDLARQLLSGYAGRGMAFSSGYGHAVGQQQADIASGLSGLDLQRQQQLADITSQRGLASTGYQNDLASSLVGTVNRLSSRAGTLGFQPRGKDIYNDPTLLVQLAKKLLGG